jgi:hypothetical protein
VASGWAPWTQAHGIASDWWRRVQTAELNPLYHLQQEIIEQPLGRPVGVAPEACAYAVWVSDEAARRLRVPADG